MIFNKIAIFFSVILITSCWWVGYEEISYSWSEKQTTEVIDKEEKFIVDIIDEWNMNSNQQQTWSILEEGTSLAWEAAIEKEEKIFHILPPKEGIKSLYYTAKAVSYAKKYDNFLKIAKNTPVNSITIDIKTVSGEVSFSMDDRYFSDITPISNNDIKNIGEIIEELHKQNIYIIGRIVVFKDMMLSEKRKDLALKWTWDTNKVWTDYSWKKYLDPMSQEVWDYNVAIASAAYELWFDELNFDYVRFPSDWRVSQIYAPFSEKLEVGTWSVRNIQALDNFSKYITEKLREKYPEIILSADVFWLVTNGDLDSIGQSLESFLSYFDYVWPMTYPSHYGRNFLWFVQPDNHPYEVIQDALKNAYQVIDDYNIEKPDSKPLEKKQIRLWLQWFSCSRCPWATPYLDNKFKLQTQSVSDMWANSWWVWNANSNYYESWYK